MEKINVATLKNRLSHYLRVVGRGGRVIVTDRGTPIAKLVPLTDPGGDSLEERLTRLQAAGHVSRYTVQPRFARVRRAQLRDTADMASAIIRADRTGRP